MIRKTLLVLFALLFVQLTVISKQIPGSSDNYFPISNGKYFVFNYSDLFTVYDIQGDSIVNSFGRRIPVYVLTNKHHNYYEDGNLKKVDIKTGEDVLSFPVSTITNNEPYKRLDFYKDNYFFYQTNSSYYLVEDTESDYEFTFLFEIEDDFKLGNNKGVFYNDGQIIYIGDDGFPRSFPHEFESGVEAFAYSDGYILYNLKEDGIDYLASYNTITKIKRRVEKDQAYNLQIVGDKVVTYTSIFQRSLSVMSFELFEYYVFQMSDKFPIKYLTPIDDSRIIATSETNSTSYLLDLDEETKKTLNRFSSNIETFTFSSDSKYIGVINASLVPDLGNKIFKVIELETNSIVYEYYYSTENFIEQIFYNDEHGFVFQSGDNELSSYKPKQDLEANILLFTDDEITSHNINDKYLFVGHNKRFDMYNLLDMNNIYNMETDGKIDLIRFNSKFVIFNNLIGFKNNGRESALFRLDLNDFESDSIFLGNHINLKLGQESAPLFGVNEKFMFQIGNHKSVLFLKLDQESLGDNRVLNGEKFGTIVSINDSVYVCTARDDPYFIKKVKFNYDDLTYEVLEDYPIGISEITYPSGSTSETDISRLVVNDNYIAYANYIENTIRIIEDNDLITSVETYETIDYDEFNQMLESGLYEVNVYDLNGRELFNETSSNLNIEKLVRNKPYLINIYNDNTSKVYKLIR